MYYAYYDNSWAMVGIGRDGMTDPTFNYFTAHRVSPHHGIRTSRYKLIEYYREANYWELFDMEADPHELRNIYGEPDTEVLTQQLTAELRELQGKYGVMMNE